MQLRQTCTACSRTRAGSPVATPISQRRRKPVITTKGALRMGLFLRDSRVVWFMVAFVRDYLSGEAGLDRGGFVVQLHLFVAPLVEDQLGYDPLYPVGKG